MKLENIFYSNNIFEKIESTVLQKRFLKGLKMSPSNLVVILSLFKAALRQAFYACVYCM